MNSIHKLDLIAALCDIYSITMELTEERLVLSKDEAVITDTEDWEQAYDDLCDYTNDEAPKPAYLGWQFLFEARLKLSREKRKEATFVRTNRELFYVVDGVQYGFGQILRGEI